ncbi:MAG: NAD(P)-dependent oxidoreductase [Bacteroidetes bacterium]|nr:MAG: NAD(P)-dependent oxidoreductase [Bacteroidota bacterium]
MKKVLVTGGSGFIGTNLIVELSKSGSYKIMSIDIAEPKIKDHFQYWSQVDIREKEHLQNKFAEFNPDIVIHLAARTDLNGEKMEDYSSNVLGVQILLDILEEKNFSGVAVFASSMYVCKPGIKPKDFDDYQPHTIYGESKVQTEKLIKGRNKNYVSAIIRPTSIWGPWFAEPYSDFFNLVLSKKYFHLGSRSCKKTYGYVGNTVFQISNIIASQADEINNKVLYLGDWPEYPIEDWANEIAATVPYKIRTLPFWFFKLLAFVGDFCKLIGIKFPMTSFRLQNMTTDNVHDLKPIMKIIEDLPFSRQEGIERTVEWIRSRKNLK